MAYVTQSQVEAVIPAPILNDALDDDRDGMADDAKLAEVIAQASQAVDAYLAGLFAVPFVATEDAAIPAPVCEAAFVFTCELVYQRRSVPEGENPFAKRADFWRTRLQMIGNRELPLDAARVKAFTPGAAITQGVSVDAQST